MSLIERSIREKIVLVGVEFPPSKRGEVEDSLNELALLVDTAGADVVGKMIQRREHPDAATYIGRGKLLELFDTSEDLDVDTVVFDAELTPAQQWNLEKILKRSAIDRSAVILDIFAQNARSREGKIQVELAQLRYRLPRLRGKGITLSQQAGGIGTRGPGETRLEVDRRRLLARISRLEKELHRLDGTRHNQRRLRHRSNQYMVTLVGYTNSGKSTLLNKLTGAGTVVEDRLFSTLDPRTRRLELPGGRTVLLSDTVGFVRKLPHQLVEAFSSTLEIATEADLLIHVVDGTSGDSGGRVAVARKVLAEIGAGDIPELVVINKADLDPARARSVSRLYEHSVSVSARTGEGLVELVDRIAAYAPVAGSDYLRDISSGE